MGSDHLVCVGVCVCVLYWVVLTSLVFKEYLC